MGKRVKWEEERTSNTTRLQSKRRTDRGRRRKNNKRKQRRETERRKETDETTKEGSREEKTGMRWRQRTNESQVDEKNERGINRKSKEEEGRRRRMGERWVSCSRARSQEMFHSGFNCVQLKDVFCFCVCVCVCVCVSCDAPTYTETHTRMHALFFALRCAPEGLVFLVCVCVCVGSLRWLNKSSTSEQRLPLGLISC